MLKENKIQKEFNKECTGKKEKSEIYRQNERNKQKHQINRKLQRKQVLGPIILLQFDKEFSTICFKIQRSANNKVK